jgi:hypothetical protein
MKRIIKNIKMILNMIKFSKILSSKAVAAFWKGTVGTLCMIVMSLFIMSTGCADNEKENGNGIVSLKDTKWRMAGFVDTQTGKMTEAVPPESECDKCYTLAFDTDSTASGYSIINIIGLGLKPVLWMRVATEALDINNGTVDMFYEAMKSVESCAVENNAMKIFYDDNKNYLLYKLIKP